MLSTIIGNPKLFANPFPILERMRQACPIGWDHHLDSWVITDYQFAYEVLSSLAVSARRVVSRDEDGVRIHLELSALVKDWAVFSDPPLHTQLRNLSRSLWEDVTSCVGENELEEIADRILGELGGQFDFVDSFAQPYSEHIIGRVLQVGSAELAALRQAFGSVNSAFGSLDPNHTELSNACAGLRDFYRVLPEDAGPRAGTEVHRNQLAAAKSMLAFGGLGTIHEALGLMVLLFCSQPEVYLQLREGIADSGFCESAINELLRWDGPTLAITRFAREHFHIGGMEIGPGERILVVVAAANRDPQVFAKPGMVALQRANSHRHLSFGLGIHRCLAAKFAKRQIAAALRVFSRHCSRFLLASAPEWNRSVINRGPQRLNVRVLR